MCFSTRSTVEMIKMYHTLSKGGCILDSPTTSELGFLDSIGFCDTFSVTYHVPTLNTNDAKKVLEQLNVFADEDVDTAAEASNDYTLIINRKAVRTSNLVRHGSGFSSGSWVVRHRLRGSFLWRVMTNGGEAWLWGVGHGG